MYKAIPAPPSNNPLDDTALVTHYPYRHGVPPLDATASAQQQLPIPGTEVLEHSQPGPTMTAGLAESEERRGMIPHGREQIASAHRRDRGVPEPRRGESEYCR